ncbi:DUF3747 domain-containing protein [Crocosphaera sp. UHCC 0190]|uniref:DUF3747 domain-containing protein n=1 Tax=Crocosphaera sp. UHCC 0190 TaxID=3110246 RepID=UPI002B220A45|nr:DUF3747 domain-containing protein [Crocosphaera sp. UHCC 0190]MEA5511564.1 DUF3747 domain-containing protein [Crocosphaera sp. UHCC 0190]
MKLTLIGKLATVTTFALINIIPHFPAQASPFEQQEVNQDEFIAITRPYGENKYDLLIVRQIPGQRQCWSENGSNPITVEPLLLNFNFTGSCERSTDSNGYSIRVDGEDYGLDYLLRIVERNGELVLVGTHRTNLSQPEIVIGRTHGIASGFLKIDLDPAWRFTKRAYGGQVLGHVYLTGDSAAIQSQPPSMANNNSPLTISNTETESSQPLQQLTFTAENEPPTSSVSPQPLPPSIPSRNTLPPPPNSQTSSEPPPLPAFSDLPPLTPPPVKTTSGVVPPPPPNATNSGRNNLSNVVGSLSRSTPTGTPKTVAVQGYRVIVAANNNSEQSRVRSLYPDAFATSYKGRSMLQVGLFSSKENAEKAYQSLENAGLNAMIIP